MGRKGADLMDNEKVEYIQMFEPRDTIIYGIGKYLKEQPKIQQNLSSLPQEDQEKIITAISSSIVDLCAESLDKEDLDKENQYDDTQYQFSMGDMPLFVNIEKILPDLIGSICTTGISIVGRNNDILEAILKSIPKVAVDVYKLFAKAKKEIRFIDYCVYMFALSYSYRNFERIIDLEGLKKYIEQIMNKENKSCKGWPIIWKNGKEFKCPFFSEGDLCSVTHFDEHIQECFKRLCSLEVLKPLGDGKFVFYK